MTAKAKMTDLVLQVRVENGTKADGKAAVKNINFNQLKLDATDQQLLDAGHAAWDCSPMPFRACAASSPVNLPTNKRLV